MPYDLSDAVAADTTSAERMSRANVRAWRSPFRETQQSGCEADVEGTVVFLASDDSAFMTGQTLIVDGGSVFSTL